MFKIKNAMMEVLSKSRSLGDVLSELEEDERKEFIGAFTLIKSKLSGEYDTELLSGNSDFVLDILNKAISEGPTLDYSKMSVPKKPRAGEGAIARRDKAIAENKKWKESETPPPSRPAINRPTIDKSEEDEEKIKQLKDKYEAEDEAKHPDPAKINTEIQIKSDKRKKILAPKIKT